MGELLQPSELRRDRFEAHQPVTHHLTMRALAVLALCLLIASAQGKKHHHDKEQRDNEEASAPSFCRGKACPKFETVSWLASLPTCAFLIACAQQMALCLSLHAAPPCSAT